MYRMKYMREILFVCLMVVLTQSTFAAVNIPDTNLRAKVLAALDKPTDAQLTLADMANLTKLDAQGAGISDLTGLQHATNLTTLWINGNQISDISVLAGLTNLTQLLLSGNQISDISALANLTNLTWLTLGGTQISDISALANLTNLEGLDLSGIQLSDISALANLTNLEGLDLSGIQLSDISALSGSTNLTGLALSNTQLSDISALSGLTNLKHLFLYDNPLSDISALSGLTNLTQLDLEFTRLSDISALANLTNLIWLNLNTNPISDISALSGLTNLKQLWLNTPWYDNQISDISVLSGLTNLENLLLNHNQISDISVLSDLTNLKQLWLNENPISDISALLDLTNLERLDLRYNPLSYASIYTHIPTLQDNGANVLFTNRTPTGLAIDSGNNQDGAISTPLAHPFVVKVTDENDAAFEGVPVTFTVTQGGGTLSTTSTTTDADGLAESTLTLGSGAGTNTVEVSASKIQQRVVFNAEGSLTGAPAQVNIPDANLRAKILAALDKPTDAQLTLADMANLTELDAPRAGISDLTGLQHATNLTTLVLTYNQLSDISALAGLTNLTQLWLNDTERISDISALANLTNLTWLTLSVNQISDISALANLTNLTTLWLVVNQISDISALANLTNLTHLYLRDNQISDISELAGLTNLKTLELLVNPLSYASIYTHIPILQQGGVDVRFTNRTPTGLAIESGDNQDGAISTPLAQPFVVKVTDENDAAFEGVPVTFTVTKGGGTLSTTSTTTDADGLAESTLTLGSSAGTNTVEVTASMIQQRVVFNAVGNQQSVVDQATYTHIYVDASNGTNAPGSGTAEQPYKTITYALLLSTRNELPDPWYVHIRPGTYDANPEKPTTEREIFPLRLRTGMRFEGTTTAAECIIDGQYADPTTEPIIRGDDTEGVIIRNLTIQNSRRAPFNPVAEDAGGILLYRPPTDTEQTDTEQTPNRVEGCIIQNNILGGLGTNMPVILTGNTFRNPERSVRVNTRSVVVTNNIFSGHGQQALYFFGNSTGQISENTFQDNTNGIYFGETTFTGNVTHNTFNNTGSGFAGTTYRRDDVSRGAINGDVTHNTFSNNRDRGFYIGTLTGDVIHNTFSNNSVRNRPGGGFAIATLTGDVAHNRFDNNSADYFRLGSTSRGGHNGGGFYISTLTGDVRSNIFNENSATGGGFLVVSFTGHIFSNQFTRNSAPESRRGGGFFIYNLAGTVHHNLFDSNQSKHSSGFELGTSPTNTVEVFNNIFFNNALGEAFADSQAASGGCVLTAHATHFTNNLFMISGELPEGMVSQGPAVWVNSADCRFHNNIFSGVGTAIFAEGNLDLPITHNLFHDIETAFVESGGQNLGTDLTFWELAAPNASDNLEGAPLLVDVPLRDFHLQAESPAINAGTNEFAPTDDYDGLARPAGGVVDIGPYEYGGKPVTFTAKSVLSVPEGISLIHVPLKVTTVDGVAKTLASVGDLYDALGGVDTVSLLITYNSQTERWNSYLGPQHKGQAADRLLTDDLGIIANMKAPVSVGLDGTALGVDGSSAIMLQPGLNLVGVPLKDERITRVSDLLALDGIRDNVSAIIGSHAGAFNLVVQADDPGDVEITGGQSFIMSARERATVTISGDAWTNAPEPTAASPRALSGIQAEGVTPVLAVSGSIVHAATGLDKMGMRVTVKNLSTGKVETVGPGADGVSYQLTFVEFATGRAAQIGDTLEISAQSANPLIGVQPLRYVVTAEDVKRGHIQLSELVLYEIPTKTELLVNYPNPFNPETWIPYRLAKDAFVTLTIYDQQGRVVRQIDVGHRTAAVYERRDKAIYWDGRNAVGEAVASGVYFYTLTTGDFTATRKMLIVK